MEEATAPVQEGQAVQGLRKYKGLSRLQLKPFHSSHESTEGDQPPVMLLANLPGN